MRFRCLAAAAIICLVPSIALAEECPEGDWFCDTPQEDADADEAPAATEAEPSPGGTDEKTGPPIVVYTPKGQPKPSKVIIVEKPAPKAKKRKIREWGFNLHLDAALMGDDPKTSKDAGMGGVGFAFRYRPTPVVALEAGLELIGGTDWNGYERRENAFLANVLLFLNPRDKFQLYWFGGFGASGARVQVRNETESFEERYSYFGLQTGLGVEGRISKKVAIGGDLMGFVRGRTDAENNTRPEFVDEDTHRATNASGGGLIRGGMTFYW